MAEDTERRWISAMAEAYERWLVPAVFRPFAVDLARRVALRGAGRVLELAAGTGAATDEILRAVPAAEVTATDLNGAMVEVGRRRVPDARWERADALDLRFDDGAFDVVACQFGVMFFPDKPTGFREARRVLAPDGALLFNTWGPLGTHDFQAALVAGFERAFPDDPPTFMSSVPHGYTDPDLIAADVRAGGFDDVTIETITLEGQAPSAADLAVGYCTGTPAQPEIEARGDLEETIAIVTSTMEERLGTGPITGSMTAYVVEAQVGGSRP
jgi:SAM-dependent methyltransferase